MPGAAFDRHGNRLGLGGGYYDRFLKKADNPIRIALAFDYQLVDDLPVTEYDTKMDVIITQSETLTFERSEN